MKPLPLLRRPAPATKSLRAFSRAGLLLVFSLFMPLGASGSVRDFSAVVYFMNFGSLTTDTRHFRIYTPPAADVPRLRGLVFMMGGSGQDWRYRVRDPVWQEASRALGFAFISVNMSVGLDSRESLESILAAAAAATGRAELVNVPIIGTGFSLGAYEATGFSPAVPERVLAVVALCGGGNHETGDPVAARKVHTLLIPSLTEAGGQGSYGFPTYRSATIPGNAAFGVNWGVGHTTFVGQEWSMAWTWIAGAAATRLPAGVYPSLEPGTPLALTDVPISSGWLGQRVYAQSGDGSDRSPFPAIGPASTYNATPVGSASWLPNEAVARAYRAFSGYDGVTGRTVPRQGPLVITGAAAPSTVVVSGQNIAPQMAVLQLGTAIGIGVNPRGFGSGTVPNASLDPIKSMSYYEDDQLLGVQTVPGSGGWSLPHTLNTPGIRSLTVVAEDWAGNRSSAFRTVIVPRPVPADTTLYRFERSPGFGVDHYGKLRLSLGGSSGSLPAQIALGATGPGSAFPRALASEPFGNHHAARFTVAGQDRFSLADNAALPSGSQPFTLETFLNLGSHATGGGLRTIATHGEGDSLGWRLFVAGEGSGSQSRRLLFRFRANDNGGQPGGTLVTIDSGFELLPGADYYLAVAFNPADTSASGLRIHLKNLTANGPLQTSSHSHGPTTVYDSPLTLYIGFGWDGLLDEVRITKRQLTVGELLISQAVPATPSALAAAPGPQPGETLLTWAPAAFAATYVIERSTSPDTGFTVVGQVATATYTDTGLDPAQTYHYRVRAANGDLHSETTATAAATPHLPATYAGWRYLHFGTNDPAAESADPQADPDGDGLRNLLEYAFGLHPMEPDGAGVVTSVVSPQAGKLEITFNRIADPGLTYAVEATSTLASDDWQVVFTSTGAQNTAGPVTVADPASIGSAHPRRFLRVVVSTQAL
ncbi:MAG: LamG-like jellyroll fold domain-containing protein [Verrucomicrobiota bacterium]